MTQAVQTAQLGNTNPAWRNRIINGAMTIDQRNAGASVTPTTSGYTLDRWQYNCTQASKMSIQQNAGSVTPPVGFANYLGITTASAYSVAAGDVFSLTHRIEGFNFADFNWGTANASTVTLSFWVRSSLTGTFGGSFRNSAANRSYPFTYTISSANTWEQKSVTIPGDVTGTWLTTNGTGVTIFFGLGAGSTYSGTAGSWAATDYNTATGATSVVGTNGATWYITGVQLEVGTAATSFEFRDYGRELIMCQRYFELVNIVYNQQHAIYYDGSQVNSMYFPFEVTKRASPTCTPTTAIKQFCNYGGGGAVNATTVTINSNAYAYQYQYAGTSMGSGPIMNMGATTIAASAEL